MKYQDKMLHALCGLLAAVIVSVILAHACAGRPLAAILGGFFAALFLGVGKEYGDRASGNRFDWGDILATAAGGAAGSMCGFAALAI